MKEENYFKEISWLDRVIQWLRFRHVHRMISSSVIVADIGAGNGALFRGLEHIIIKGYALDRYANRRESGKVTFIPFNVDTDSVKDLALTSADVVTALAVIEHVYSPEVLMSESFHLLKPGGKLILTTPTPRSRWLLELFAFRLGLTNKKGLLEHRRYLWGYQLYTLAKDVGFSSVQWHEFELGMNTLCVAVK